MVLCSTVNKIWLLRFSNDCICDATAACSNDGKCMFYISAGSAIVTPFQQCVSQHDKLHMHKRPDLNRVNIFILHNQLGNITINCNFAE